MPTAKVPTKGIRLLAENNKHQITNKLQITITKISILS